MSELTDQTIGNIPIVHNYEYTSLDNAQAATWSSGDVFKAFKITDFDNLYLIETSGGRFRIVDTREVVEVSTTDDTETTLWSIDASDLDNYTYKIYAGVDGVVNGGGNTGGYDRIAKFKIIGGTLSQVGSTASVATFEDDANWNCQIDSSGTEIRVRVTGVAATNIDWLGKIKVEVQKDE